MAGLGFLQSLTRLPTRNARHVPRLLRSGTHISRRKDLGLVRRTTAGLHTSATVNDNGMFSPSPSSAGFHDYDEERKKFKLEKQEYFNFATDVIDKWADNKERDNGPPALWWVGIDGNEVKLSFKQLSESSKKVANILRGPCKLDVGDRFIVIATKVPPWWLINLAAIRAGLVLIPGTTQLTSKDIRLRLERSGAQAIIATEDIAERIDEVAKDFDDVIKSKLLIGGKENRPGWLNYEELFNNASPEFQAEKTRSDDPLTIFFTSGTTGYPKMCLHTHASYGQAHYITGKYWMDLTPMDVHWALSDTGWAKSAWSNLYGPWQHGACVFIMENPKFDPIQTLKVLEKYPITTFCAPPTGYRFMIQEELNKYKFNALRHCLSAGEPLNAEVTETWYDGVRHTIREGYGQTETVLLSAAYRCLPNKPGSMGKPPPGVDVRIVDGDANEVGHNVEGDIALKVFPDRPIGLFKEYVGDAAKTESTFRGDYYLTGDRAYKDEEGYLWFVGRSDDVIMSAGYRIGPFEVESALIEHPAVAESAVVSSPHETRGEIVKAFIVLTDKHKNQDSVNLVKDIQDHVKRTTAPYKYPREIEFVEGLPKTISGKIRRIELRESEWKNKK